MKSVIVKHLKTNQDYRFDCADSFWKRFLGLMFKKTIDPHRGLFFPNCNSVHMWFMRVPIDIIFARRTENNFIIKKIIYNAKPWSLLPYFSLESNSVFELKAGTAEKFSTGDSLCISS